MKHADEFRDPAPVADLVAAIRRTAGSSPVRLMEVCGTHTVAIFRSGLRQLLKEAVSLISGPGCPVCVTAQKDVDFAIGLATRPGVLLATYGDMLKVPGTRGSLQQARAGGADVRVVYSTLDAVRLAEANPSRQVVFLGVGFEKTAPAAAVALEEAGRRNLSNFFVYSVHKLVPPALKGLLDSGETALDGLILPGHVSAMIGLNPYQFLAEDYGLPATVTGFEPLDLLSGILRLVEMARGGTPAVTSEYRRVVRPEGNIHALAAMNRVFVPAEATWRGLGAIPGSGLALRGEYARFDAALNFEVDVSFSREPEGCRCGEVLRGRVTPRACRLFGEECTPAHAVGPCMVSSEGTCAAYHAYAPVTGG